jgi:Flp pilus assembly protein TadB
MVVHGSAVALYLGFLAVLARREKRRVRRTMEQMPSAGPCWISPDS